LRYSVPYQRIFFVLLLLSFLAQTFGTNWLLADYYANTSKYASYCENKQKPELKCKGKCQMMKRIKEEEQKDKENPERKAETKIETTVYFRSSKEILPTAERNSEPVTRFFSYTEGVTLHRSATVFHPPRLIVPLS
jgi:hypothetical protein